jgi:hypothetical protein
VKAVLSVFHEKSADEYEDMGAVKTQPRARTMAFDRKTKKIFLSTARVCRDATGDPGRTRRPHRQTRTFVILVVGK